MALTIGGSGIAARSWLWLPTPIGARIASIPSFTAARSPSAIWTWLSSSTCLSCLHAGLRVHSGEDGLYRVEDRHGERWIIGTPGPRKIYPQEKLWLLTSVYSIATNVHRREQPP